MPENHARTHAAGASLAMKPITIPMPSRGDDLEVRVSAPVSGAGLPVVVFAHGYGESLHSYDPLIDYWAAQGLVVIQPTFLDSRELGLSPSDPRQPEIWRLRVDDLEQIIDGLDDVVALVPGLAERVDTTRLAVAGHSWGGQTASMLLGARVLDAEGEPGPSRLASRIKAGVLLSTPGLGDELTPFAQKNFGFMRPDFTRLTTPTLVVAGERDQSPLTTRGPDWFADAYRLSPGSEHLVTLLGGEHSLGGIEGYRSIDTTDENPAGVALIRELSLAFLLTALGTDPAVWSRTSRSLATGDDAIVRLDSKG